MEREGFCVGSGSPMGMAGFKWAGRDPMDDCSMIWLKKWGLTDAYRAALACTFVFFLAALSQYLSTSHDYHLQQSKDIDKRRLFNALTQIDKISTYYDPELCNGCDKKSTRYELEQAVRASALHSETQVCETQILQSTSEKMFSRPLRDLPLTAVKAGNWTHLGDALMRGVRVFIAYMLMLVIMTYDLTLITSIVMGFVASFVLCGKDMTKVPVSADPCCCS